MCWGWGGGGGGACVKTGFFQSQGEVRTINLTPHWSHSDLTVDFSEIGRNEQEQKVSEKGAKT